MDEIIKRKGERRIEAYVAVTTNTRYYNTRSTIVSSVLLLLLPLHVVQYCLDSNWARLDCVVTGQTTGTCDSFVLGRTAPTWPLGISSPVCEVVNAEERYTFTYIRYMGT